jgi:two-component system, LytTR family, sensor kinase
MNRASAFREQLGIWGLILGLWLLLVLAFAGQLVFTNGLDWLTALTLSLRDWYPWAVLAPLAAWLAHRFPLERGRLAVSIPVHVAACMLAVLASEVLARPNVPPPRAGVPGGPPWRGRPNRPLDERPDRPLDELPNRPPLQPGQRPPGEFPADRYPGAGPQGRPLNAIVMRAKLNIPIYWIIVSVVHALSYSRRYQERERKSLELEARLTEAKLQALRMQLHPHFLFNTLNAISTLVHRDPNAADEMIANLSELLRATLDTSEPEIPLRQELQFLDRYLEIQQARFGDRLQINRQIDTTALDARVPTLVLQPLVENAIRHGLEPQPGRGLLEIQVRRQGASLHLSIHDNGVGLKQPGATEGIGLANTRERLQQLYGSQARLVLSSSSRGGCTAEIELPYRNSSANPSTTTPAPSTA